MDLDDLRRALDEAVSNTEIDTARARSAVALRVQRHRWRRPSYAVAVVVALLVAVAGGAVLARSGHGTPVSVTPPPTAPPAQCDTAVAPALAAGVPHDVAAWAHGAPVVGAGALWTVRSAIAVPPIYTPDGWSLKFPWYTRPFGMPIITARRLDGFGRFHSNVNPANDARGNWVVSSLTFSDVGCWEVTATYGTSSLPFRLRVGSEGADSLRAAATSWANAFLTGTINDMHAMQGPECSLLTSSTFDPQFLSNYLDSMRAELARHIGRPLSTVRIVDVRVRNVTDTSGEAEVQYDLPASAVGNDNWVTFARQNGHWKVSDCHAPIGGSSSSSSGSATAPSP